MSPTLKLPFLILLISTFAFGTLSWRSSSTSGPLDGRKSVGIFPPTCNRIECPKFEVILVGNGFEIRRYNLTMWTSTSPIQDISLVEATRTGFLQLFNYIQGNNDYKEKIEMTAPVITQVVPSDGPFCSSMFVVSFYLPQKNQADPPPAENLHVQKWGLKYVAVRQFSGFASDYGVGQEAAALYNSLVESGWSTLIDKALAADPTSTYTVAQYNSPFEFKNRVNEIWMMVDMEDVNAI
ncbi:uncharacterized protein LOC131240846 [Magnolia sinica]|uniref:uncharacterized protein LOC131240846 n=1 Tax=Magnolia sinica TaxID=86752 RepID=UPI0026597660|nr:uncharacterized protein LOC131240846 [Magnolia sinica]